MRIVKSLLSGNDAEGTKTGTVAVTEESSAVGDVVRGHFIIVKLAGKRSTPHYIAEVTNECFGCEYKIGNCKANDNTR
jgi:hypothetical protein